MKRYVLGVAVALATAVAVAFAAASPAKADFITGEIGVAGNADSYVEPDITFTSTGSAVTFVSGDFAAELGLILTSITVTFPGAGPYDATNFAAALGATPLFTLTNSAVAKLLVSTSVVDSISSTNVTLHGTGVLSLTGGTGTYDPTPGSWGLSLQPLGAGSTRFNFSAGAVAVPGPELGAGLPGLLAACFGLMMLVRRRRARLAA